MPLDGYWVLPYDEASHTLLSPIMTLYPRGSEWRRWDLHVHTPLSILANKFPNLPDGTPDWEAYLQRLEQLGDVAVLGVTDYFTIDGYKQLLEFRRDGRLANIQCILPNIEFRLDKVVASRRDGATPRRLNFHVLFSEEVPPEEIEEHFLHDIPFHYEGNPQGPDDERKLKRSNLEELGNTLQRQHAAFRDGRTPLVIGATTAVVDHSKITSLLTRSTRFKDKYLLVLPEELSNLIDWDGQDHLTRKVLLQKSDLVFSSNERTIQWCLGQPPYDAGRAAFIDEFKTLKACIHGSDAHSLGEVGHPCARRGVAGHDCSQAADQCELRHCWIKADPSFEGLKQLLYEPADRVRIQPADPTTPKSIFSLESFSIAPAVINSELSFADTMIPLNKGLVAITGGKGSGKTALVDLIAHSFTDRRHTDERNSFVRRVADTAPPIQTSLEFANGTVLAKTFGDANFFSDANLVYIAQGELERYIDENSNLDAYIHNLVFNSSAIKDTVDAFDYESLASTTRRLQADLEAKNELIEQLETATADTVVSGVLMAGRQAKADLDDLNKRITLAETKLTKETIQASEAKQKVITDLKASRDQLVAARDLVDATLRSLDNELTKVAASIQRLNEIIGALGLGAPLAVPDYPDRTRLVEVRGAVLERLKAVVGEIEQNEKALKGLTKDMQDHATLLGKRQELQTKHVQLQKQWKDLEAQKARLTTERATRSDLVKQLLTAVLSQKTKYDHIIGTFGAAKDSVLSDLDFAAVVSFDSAAMLAAAHDVVDNRQVEVSGTDKTPSVFAGYSDLMKRLVAGDVTAIDPLVAEVDSLADQLKSKLKKTRAVSVHDLYRTLYQFYLSVRPTTLYKRTPLDRLSLGQKATVLIKIYLAEGDKPIIIDSHDDHLDNEFIMEELVNSIRQAKEFRQVILASNNGNVVINSDAEQVVVAQRQDGVISYLSGSLENSDIRERALRVLEGGADAFKRRQEKYRIMG